MKENAPLPAASAPPGIAIIGMAGRFPGAPDVASFWRNLRDGVESISHFADAELEDAFDRSVRDDPNFVRARSVLEGVEEFDAAFFAMRAREAELTDPQHRVFLECAWQALEDAGYDPATYKDAIGVFAGCSMSTYFLRNVLQDRQAVDLFTSNYQVGSYGELLGALPDVFATRLSYKLGLRGPAMTVQTACSTSLVAIAQACQSLLLFESDMVLAGGVSITFPQRRGYLALEGAMVSPTGHVRTFDAKADGTVFGSGAGVVLLKRVEDAIADGDHIYAVIRGSALNNDGAVRAGFTAPSVNGQWEVIAAALANAEVDARSIGYVECHGTATPLGDPIEVAGLTRAFRAATNDVGFCALGSVKPNVGHLDAAAGVAGLIKTALALQNRQLPATLFFETPNPHIAFEGGPFYVNREWREWPAGKEPRRAGVSAFGVGGTNAHVVLEEAPVFVSEPTSRPTQIICVSARTPSALATARRNLATHLRSHPDLPLADAAYTTVVGRRAFSHRAAVAVTDLESAAAALESGRGLATGAPNAPRPLAFMFPGQGAQYPAMGLGLFETERAFRDSMRLSAEILRPALGADLSALLYGEAGARLTAEALQATEFAQPALFAVSYALAALWRSFGVTPQLMIGHSVGEFVAACLAGVFSHEDALRLIAARGRLMQETPRGSMMAVRLPEAELTPFLSGPVALAAINGPKLCVAAGPDDAIAELDAELSARGVMVRRLHTSHAFHSPMMDPAAEALRGKFEGVRLSAPKMRLISSMTGDWLTPAEATSPDYWAAHCRAPVRFAAGLATLLRDAGPDPILIEAGPGVTLSTLARQGGAGAGADAALASLPDAARESSDSDAFARSAAQLWCSGAAIDWRGVHSDAKRRRVSLPTYPFERMRCWIDAPTARQAEAPAAEAASAPRELGPSPSPLAVGIFAPPATSPETSSPMAAAPMPTPPQSTPDPNGAGLKLREHVVEIFESLSGESIAHLAPETSFLEMGFDSLFLSQVTQQLQRDFKTKLTFRQLLGDLSTIPALTAHLEANLPPEFRAAQAAPPPAAAQTAPSVQPAPPQLLASTPPLAAFAPLGSPNSAGSGSVEQIFRDQLDVMSRLMAQQLDALRGVASPAAGQSPALAPQPATRSLTPQAAPAAPTPSVSAALPAAAMDEPKSRFEMIAVARSAPPAEMNETQQRALAELISRFNKRTAESKRMTQECRPVLADPRAAAGFRTEWKDLVYPVVSDRASGSRIYDVDGNSYIDLVNGYGQTFFGHAAPFVVEAVGEQLRKGFAIGPQSALAGRVATLFSELTGNERVTFCNTGSEAVMAAMRVARTVTGRSAIATFTGDYHGQFDEVLVKGTLRSGVARAMPAAAGIPSKSVENMVVLPYGAPESLEWIRVHAGELAAVLVEPVQSRHPELRPVEFLQEIRAITETSGAALIFDEVVTGFRMHPGGMQHLFGIKADLATYGKVVGGGLPVGILAGKAVFMDALDGGCWNYGDNSFPETGMTFFAGTFVRHPLVMAAVWSVLNHLKEQGAALQESVSARTAALVKRLNGFVRQRELDFHLETFGSLFFFNLGNVSRYASLFYPYMLERGVYVQEHYPCFLTTAHSDADIAAIAEAFEDAIVAMQKADFFPAPPGLGPEPETEVPLTEAQTEIWLSAQLSEEASCAFNESMTLRLRGALDRKALGQALAQLIARHDALRAVFRTDGERMRILPALELDLVERDLELTPESMARDAWSELLAHDARTPFDLVNGPLLRAQLVRFAADDHALVLTAHHIICDGWSFNVMIGELTKLYQAAAGGIAADLPAPMSFARYGVEERARQKREGAAVDAFWLPQFTPPPPPLDLPTDRPRRLQKTFAGATLTRRIDAELTQLFRKATARQGCTLFVALLAAFEALLARLAGQNEVVVGIPAAGQSLVEGDSLVGHCVNFLPLRGRWSDETTVAEHLAATRQIVLAAYENQSFTLGTLVRKMALPREAGRRPLVEAQFNLERLGDKIRLPGLEIEAQSNPKAAVIFDLFFNITEQDGGLRIDCDYNTDLFDEATIERWIGQYRTLLGEIAADPARRVSALPLLSPDERAWLNAGLNATAAHDLDLRPVHELIAAQAARTPDAIAARFAEAALSYRELDERANRLASHLRGVVNDPAGRIGVATERSLDMLIALLAIMKTGCAYVPLDPSHPAARLRLVLDSAAVSAVVCDNAFLGAMAPGVPIVRIDSDAGAIAARPSDPPPVEANVDRPCYVIFTSGSTGAPKGVEIAHRSVANLLWSIARTLGAGPRDTLIAATTISFDIAALELYLPLITGGSVVIASRDDVRGGFGLARLIEKAQATIVQATPSLWRILTEAGFKGRPGLHMLCGGEALPRDLADALLDGGGELWNVYGPTETTIWSSIGPVPATPAPITIGAPVLNTQLYVLDKARELAPVGVVGELFIGGAGLALGYFRRPDLDAAAFFSIAVGGGTPQRLYRTGDLARRLADGSIEVLGRIDTQVKLRGFRIELEEIESVVRACPGVSDCVASIEAPAAGTPRLVGYYVAAPGQALSAPELSAHAALCLPDYMVPAIWVRLDALPLTPNGKLDRKSLPKPDLAQTEERRVVTPPRTPLEAKLAAIWREVLQIDEIGIHDNIFALGADSIHLFRIAARMLAQDIGLEARHLMRFPTIAELAEAASDRPAAAATAPLLAAPSLKNFRRGAQVEEIIRMTAHRTEDELDCSHAGSGPHHPPEMSLSSPSSANLVFPCSASQNRCWFINSLSPGNAALNVALRWEISGRLSSATVELAFQAIVDRHEILRSRFFEKDGEAMQEALNHLDFKLSVIDLTMLPEAEQIKEALKLGEREAHLSFDLSQAPPIRVTFLRLSSEHAFLLVTVHQIAFDGWSIRVLANEFGVIAEALNGKRPYDLPQPPLQYGDYCLWQKEYFASGVFEAETAYWKKQLGDAPYFEVVPDHPRPSRPTYKGVILASILPADLGDKLEEAARNHNLTLFSFGCAVTGAMLHRYTGETDVIFGTQIAGRDDPDLENMIGMFINNLVMRFDASGDPSFETFLSRVNGTVQDALINQRMPFEKLVEILNPPRDPKRTPLISVNFTVLRDVMDHKSYGDFVLHGQPSLSAGSLYDLIFFMVHWPNGWRMAMEYNPDLFERRTAERLLDFLMSTFEFAILHPQAKLSSLTPPVRDLIDAPKPREDLVAIEAALLRRQEVKEAFVAPAPDHGEDPLPYAYVAPKPDVRVALETLPAKLKDYLKEVLPAGARQPGGVSILMELPRNARGEVDQLALPPPPAHHFLLPAEPAVALRRGQLSNVESKLAAIWRELLRVQDIEPASNFFELGGHSLLTIRLMARVAAEFGVKLEPVALFQAPTLREFAACLPAPQNSPSLRRLVQIQPEGDKTPIFAINNSVLYYNLARRIGTERPFVGIPLLQADGDAPAPVQTLSEIAIDYVRLIRESQPHGPYILCGLCVAGALAYECAQQLTAAGESVPLLILSDIWVPGYLASYPFGRRLIYHLLYWTHTLCHRLKLMLSGKAPVADVLSTFTIVRKTRLLEFASAIGLIDGAQLSKRVIDRSRWLFLYSLETARGAYKIAPIKSDVVLLQSDEIVTTFADPNMGWTDLVKGRLFVQRIPGWHEDMFFQDEGASVIAKFLEPILEEIDAERDRAASTSKDRTRN